MKPAVKPAPASAIPATERLAALPPAVWRADQIARGAAPSLSSGYATLDAELPGAGWPVGALTELIANAPGVGELRLLVPVLRQLTRERRVVILLGPPHIPYAPALSGFGIDIDYLILVEAVQAADRIWAIEQALRSASFGALLAWLPQERTRPEHLRRLQLAAHGASGPVFLFRDSRAQFDPSPAPLRMLLQARAAQRIAVQILKRRGPLCSAPQIIDLPQPAHGIRLRPGSGALASPERSLHAIHPRPDEIRSPALQ